MKRRLTRAATPQRLGRAWFCLAALVIALSASADDDELKWTLGGQVGGDTLEVLEEDADIWTLYGRRQLPEPNWFARWTPTGTQLKLEAAFAHFDNEFDDNEQLAVGPIAVWRAPARPWRITVGVQPTLINDAELAGRDMGGAFQLTNVVGVGVDLRRHVFAELQWRHVSNAELYSANDGVDVQVFSLGWRF